MIYYNKYDLVYDVVIRRRANLLGDAILSKIRDAIVDRTQTSRSSETKLSREIGSLINFDNATWIEPLACRPSWTFGYLPRPLLYDERDAIIYYIIISVITIFECCIDGMIIYVIYVIFLDISCSTVSRDKGTLCGLLVVIVAVVAANKKDRHTVAAREILKYCSKSNLTLLIRFTRTYTTIFFISLANCNFFLFVSLLCHKFFMKMREQFLSHK